jgi:type I restriction-modification system DNA methylase subunit
LAGPSGLIDLVERFERNRDAYMSGAYNETQVRREFIDPFFELLGWDIANKQGQPEAYKDVVHEDAVRIGGGLKAPDYGFRVGGTRRFFVEAKKPSVNVRDNASPAFQLRRYAWSAKLPLSILTDFEEFAVYDCRITPDKTDSPATARLDFYSYAQYSDRWDEIAGRFSRDAVLTGSLEAYADVAASKRGSATVDTVFLKEIESWRDALAKDLALRNPDLTSRQLNFAVQMSIDRIIFLRMAEDRGIEEYGRLQALLNGRHIYDRLRDLYRQADERYNSGLFHFQQEKDRPEQPDQLTPKLIIGDEPLKNIIKNLYFPDSPYEFSVLPVEVLGQVYEQFLGKTIDLTPGRGVTIEEKPEVRKAGGVYYTPKYIVDYIVEHTVGKLLDGKTPGKSGTASKLRIVDPACGSGSFLIGAYEFLLDWHRDRYLDLGPEKHRKEIYQGSGGQWLLTTAEKKRILLNNIYGVDIDPQAVEVTKLSLLLKVLEGESAQTIGTQLAMFHERALPDLSNNIKCGNSLIGPDFYDNQQLALLGEDDHFTINVFDWKKAFPSIFSGERPGFDAVIGNPPYLNIDDVWGKGDLRQRYIKRAYSSVYNDKTDILFYFLAKAVQISRSAVSFIVSRAFLEAFKADKLRGWLSTHTDITEIIDFRNHYVFEGVGITTAIVSLTKARTASAANIYRLTDEAVRLNTLPGHKQDTILFQHIAVNQDQFASTPWLFAAGKAEELNRKIDALGQPLGQVLHIGQGMQTGRNDVFGNLSVKQVTDWGLKPSQYFTRARNSDIRRYHINVSDLILLYLEDFQRFEDLPGGVQQHLHENEDLLKERAAYQRGNCDWWRYTWPLHRDYIKRPKILCPYLATDNRFALDEQQRFLGLTDTTVLYDSGQPEQLRYLLALLNSRLLTYRFRFIGKLKSAGIIEYFWNSVSKLPVRRVESFDESDWTIHDQILTLVDRATDLRDRRSDTLTSQDKTILQNRIDAVDRQIDQFVYQLYGLTEDEITLVEQAN